MYISLPQNSNAKGVFQPPGMLFERVDHMAGYDVPCMLVY